ncbi:hypothetical protein EDD16DRAFT_1702786 [Pisolithus croceorrhizus]|nr:hypothetical protein EDD16DRAFT_1702786 [Pisolithus croceorrhizus]KAI6150130.1 hypothetical protein EDD17DRAFT_1766017 [Pisolithus thermaeus]
MKEASRECSESVPTEEHTIVRHEIPGTRPLHPKISLPEVEMTAAPGVVEQKTAEVSVNVLGDTQMLPLHNNQYQQPKPRPAVNRSLQNSTEDAFSLCTRYHPTHFPAVNATSTLSVASAQLLSAKEGLVDKTLEGDTVSDSSHDAPQEAPGHHAICSPQPPLASYNATNPFAHLPYTQLPENIPDQLPGPAMQPLHAQQLDTIQDNNHMQYNFDNAASWYTVQQGPYALMLYMPQPFHHPHLLPDACAHAPASIPESEHMDNGIHNVVLQYHDTYYPGMVNSGEQYHLAYQEPFYYPFHPPRPPLVHPGPISCLDGNTNALSSTTHPQNVSRGDKDGQENHSI